MEELFVILYGRYLCNDGGIIAVQTIYGCHCKNLNTPFHHISAGSPSRIRFNKKENNSHNGFEYSILIFASHVGGTCSCFKLVTSCLMLF
ncbi:unnamed protein product, partial [Vitis vinifera]|uniref:Uncharacterized protein n=1 Tax=Vitis vinifera TaxID=29760 RepID=D7SJL7_VITVI